MQVSEQTKVEPSKNTPSSTDTSVSDARWMLGFVALLGFGVLALGLIAELLLTTTTL